MFAASNAIVTTQKDRLSFAANAYFGASFLGYIHVLRIPPALVMINPMATAVARRVWEAELLGTQDIKDGAVAYTPIIKKHSAVYFCPKLVAVKKSAKPIIAISVVTIADKPRCL